MGAGENQVRRRGDRPAQIRKFEILDSNTGNVASGIKRFFLFEERVYANGFRFGSSKALLGPVFHISIHRYFVFTLRIALTSLKQLFSFALVDG